MEWKKVLPLIIGIALSITFAIFAIKSMNAGDHSPSGVINNEYNGTYFLEDF